MNATRTRQPLPDEAVPGSGRSAEPTAEEIQQHVPEEPALTPVGRRRQHRSATDQDGIDAVLAAARVLVAASAQSVAELADTVTLPQLRLLVMVESRAPMTLSAVADELRVHPSNATRAVDRLVSDGLLARSDDPADRRHLRLEPTSAGRDLVNQVMQRRRATIEAIMAKMSPDERHALRVGAAAFAALGELSDSAAWQAGWPTHEPAGGTL